MEQCISWISQWFIESFFYTEGFQLCLEIFRRSKCRTFKSDHHKLLSVLLQVRFEFRSYCWTDSHTKFWWKRRLSPSENQLLCGSPLMGVDTLKSYQSKWISLRIWKHKSILWKCSKTQGKYSWVQISQYFLNPASRQFFLHCPMFLDSKSKWHPIS